MLQADLDRWHMTRALELAALGRGGVEPNPLVGCLIAHGAEIVGEGWHRRFGGPHAEIEALRIAGNRAAGATMYVTLEPCCHHGKTPPCTDAVIAAGLSRVVVAMRDPFPQVSGDGVQQLEVAGVDVETGVCQEQAAWLNAPYLKLLERRRPWVIAKWAMTLDGKLAAHTGSSRWISGGASRRVAHHLRGRVDAILVGSGTALADDPLLTVRPPGRRTPLRIVLDSHAALPLESQLVRTASEAPVMIAAAKGIDAARQKALEEQGCEVLVCAGATPAERLDALLVELGKRRLTNVLIEGGSRLLGAAFDRQLIDEVHVFIAPKLIGGAAAPSPIAGQGLADMTAALALDSLQVERLDDDIYLSGRVPRAGVP